MMAATLPLPGVALPPVLAQSAQSLGIYGEQWAARALQRAGYTISFAHTGEKRGDLLLIDQHGAITFIEVKTARRSTNGWKFCLRKGRKTDCRRADVLMLLAVDRIGLITPFILSTTATHSASIHIGGKHPRDYSGRYAQYRQPAHNLNIGACFERCV